VTDKAAFKISFGEGMVLPGQLLSYADIASEPKVDLTQVRGGGAGRSTLRGCVCRVWARRGAGGQGCQ
jgi:hypothetical protein